MMHDSSLEHLVLSDGDVVIRSAHSDDERLLLEWLNDPQVYAFWGEQHASRESAARHCRVQIDDEDTCWPFIISRGTEPAGFIQAWGTEGRGGLDLFIAPEYRRRGNGLRAITMLATHLRDAHGWTRITVDPRVDNERALAFFRRAGFVDTGERRLEGDHTLAIMEFR